MSTCLNCNKEIEHTKKHCNQSCAAKTSSKKRKEAGWSPSTEQRTKTSIALKGRIGHTMKRGEYSPRKDVSCSDCGATFRVLASSNRKYCSSECSKKYVGGYRDGSGRAKTGYYHGVYCGSTYELVWVIYQLDHNLPFERFPGYVADHDTKQKYFPDFIQFGKIIEIKGYENPESVATKTAIANKNGYDVIVKYKIDLSLEFEYVISKYGKQLTDLYDNYVSKFEYVCDCCGKTILTDNKRTTDRKYCSRVCSGAGHLVIPNPAGKNQHTVIQRLE